MMPPTINIAKNFLIGKRVQVICKDASKVRGILRDWTDGYLLLQYENDLAIFDWELISEWTLASITLAESVDAKEEAIKLRKAAGR